MPLCAFKICNAVSGKQEKFVIESAAFAFCDEIQLFQKLLTYTKLNIFLIFHLFNTIAFAQAKAFLSKFFGTVGSAKARSSTVSKNTALKSLSFKAFWDRLCAKVRSQEQLFLSVIEPIVSLSLWRFAREYRAFCSKRFLRHYGAELAMML